MLNEAVKQKIKHEIGFDFSNVKVKPLSGGDINTVLLFSNSQTAFVIKINEARRFPKMLEKEAQALAFLHQNSPLRYPKVLAQFEDEIKQYLVLEYVEQTSESEYGSQQLGIKLADQHQLTNSQFGWKEYNYIGSLKQPNTWKDVWEDFYASERLLYQTKLAFDAGLVDQKFSLQMERFCVRLSELFPKEPPALLHGDLWGGNYFITDGNVPFLYDPAVYFGHREMDLGMTKLFGGFDTVFYDHYQNHYPLEKGWENRIPYTQLYPNLVHLNLFGRSYLNAVKYVIRDF